MTENLPVGTGPRALERRARAALRMRTGEKWTDDEGNSHIEIYTWDEITDILGYASVFECRTQVEKVLEKDLAEDPNSKGRMREIASRRLEQLLRSGWKKATDEEREDQHVYIQRMGSVINDWIKLHGLAAPQEFINHNPSSGELHQWVAEIIQTEQGVIEEDDIFAGEIVTGEIVEEQAN